jgi:hypothetical protein
MPWSDEHFPRARRPHKLPIVLSPEEVVQFFDHVPRLRYRAALMACYGAGLRVSEVVALKITDIDSKRCCSASSKAKDARTATPCFRPGCWKCWPPFGGPQQVLEYLGRYTHRENRTRCLTIKNRLLILMSFRPMILAAMAGLEPR